MKAIETSYKGYRFRSRLEARVAVLLTEAGIPFVYEPEGFAFEDGTTYLPDFYLPNQDAFLECKGLMTEKDHHKIEQLAKETRKDVVVFYPGLDFTLSYWVDDLSLYRPAEPGEQGLFESESWLCKCPKCGKKYFGDQLGSWVCKCCGYYDEGCGVLLEGYAPHQDMWKYGPLIKAKQARFEFGEAGDS